MAAINYNEWGFTDDSTSLFVGFAAPSAPAVNCWQTESTSDTNMKYRARVFYVAFTDEAQGLHLYLIDGGESGIKILSDKAAPDWDDTFSASTVTKTDDYPNVYRQISELYSYNVALPHFPGYISVYPIEETFMAAIYGCELSCQHDEVYDGLDMELFDYSSGTGIWEPDCPASSFILTRMVAEAQNKILYNSGWRIGVAIGGETR